MAAANRGENRASILLMAIQSTGLPLERASLPSSTRDEFSAHFPVCYFEYSKFYILPGLLHITLVLITYAATIIIPVIYRAETAVRYWCCNPAAMKARMHPTAASQ